MSEPQRTYCPEGYTYAFPRPGMSAEVVVLVGHGAERKVLLVRRARDPQKGMLALPGGHVEAGESAAQAAARELQEETGVRVDAGHLAQVGAFTDPERAAPNWVIGVAHLLELDAAPELQEGEEGALLLWTLAERPALAFDHNEMLDAALALADRSA